MSKDFASLIDRARLQEAIARVHAPGQLMAGDYTTLFAAAEAYLATLPKPTKTVYDLSARAAGKVPRELTYNSLSECREAGAASLRDGYTHVIITERVLP